MGFLEKFRQGLARTKQSIVERFDEIVRVADEPAKRSRPIDVETVGALEELLISADIGVAATDRIISSVTKGSRNGAGLRDLVKQEIRSVFTAVDRPIVVEHRPQVTLIVGVNGTGKTTTVGKLANLLKSQGRNPLVCAADTFRAAAVEQLEIWSKRAGVDIIRAREGRGSGRRRVRRDFVGQEPGPVRSSSTRPAACTPGTNLMNELEKIRRIAAREVPGAPQEVLLVLDATVGQNGVAQAREFMSVAGVNGIVPAKLDGTAKGRRGGSDCKRPETADPLRRRRRGYRRPGAVQRRRPT
jgi:fused signal recognition particle receptor